MQPIIYEEKAKKVVFTDADWEWDNDFETKPDIEKKLFALQSDFYLEKDTKKKHKIWEEMFTIIQKYAKSLVLKKNKGHRFRDPTDIEDDATQTALSFMSQYVSRPGYHVGASFAGMLNPKVLETLYKYNKDDQNMSLNALIGNTNLEMEDMQKHLNFESLYNNVENSPGDFINRTSIKELITDIIREFNSEVEDEGTKLKVLCYITILLRKSRNKHTRHMFFRHITPDKKEYDLIQLFELEVYNRLRDAAKD